jgi:hypothetical protein
LNAPRKRSWLTIRLRTLLLLTLASGCVLGLIGRESRQARRREEAARDLAQAASKIDIEYCNFWGRRIAKPPPAWQRRLLGEHYFQRVTGIVISPSLLRDDGGRIGELKHLRSFELTGASWTFTDRHAQALSRLPQLETVSLRGANITDEAVPCLSSRQPLRAVDVSHTLVSDAGVALLAKFPALERLDLSETLVTDEGVKLLAAAPELKSLVLGRVMVSDDGVAALAHAPRLEHLALAEMPLTGEAFAAVATAPALREVVAGGGLVFRGEKLAGLRTPSEHQEAAVRTLGRPSVYWAIDRRHSPRNTPYLRWLLEHGAEADEAKDGMSAASILAVRGAVEPVGVLLDCGANLNPHRRESWRAPLAAAALAGHLEMMRFLLDRGADPNLADCPALVFAASGGNLEAIQLLADFGADVNRADPNGATPLAAGIRRVDVVHALLKLGADPNRFSGEGYAPLHVAAAAGNLPIVKLLLEHGANRFLKNHRGETAYAIALQQLAPESRDAAEICNLLKPTS